MALPLRTVVTHSTHTHANTAYSRTQRHTHTLVAFARYSLPSPTFLLLEYNTPSHWPTARYYYYPPHTPHGTRAQRYTARPPPFTTYRKYVPAWWVHDPARAPIVSCRSGSCHAVCPHNRGCYVCRPESPDP